MKMHFMKNMKFFFLCLFIYLNPESSLSSDKNKISRFEKLELFNKVLYLVASFICRDTSLPKIPKKTTAFTAVKINILRPINFILLRSIIVPHKEPLFK